MKLIFWIHDIHIQFLAYRIEGMWGEKMLLLLMRSTKVSG